MRALDALSFEVPPEAARDSGYAPAIPIAAAIGPNDIRGPIVGSHTDRFGRDIVRHYADAGHILVLAGPGFRDFEQAVRTLHGQRSVREVTSEATIGRLVFEWICATRLQGPGEPLLAFVDSKLATLVRETEIVLPIFGLHIETPLVVGMVTFSDISEEELATWRARSCRSAPEHLAAANEIHDKLGPRLQGRAAARFKAVAEADYAVERGTEQAELSLALLRLASVGAFMPERSTTFALAGREGLARGIHLELGPDDSFSSSEYIVHPDDQRPLVLDETQVRQHILPVIAHWASLLTKATLTPFENAALKSVLLYSRATRYRNVSEKLIHIFAAIESLLLRNENEPISVTVADRLAFAVGQNADDRMGIVRNLRDVYAMRSRFVHHALETAPDGEALAKLESFLVTISQFFLNFRKEFTLHETKEGFIEALERRKYA